MLAKTSSVQQNPPRRAPLSLSTSVKPKTNEKNDNNKKETTNNQKTENLKKESHQERKLSADKKQSSTESKRSSSTSSTDSKKLEDNKNNKNEDNKKSQNGVNGNGIKDKQPSASNANEGASKTKPEPSSNGSASKKDSQKLAEKKKDPVVVDTASKNDNKVKTAEKIKETKIEENKIKPTDKIKEKKTVDVSTTQALDQDKTKEKKEEVKVAVEKKKNDDKIDEVKNVATKNPEETPIKETNVMEQEVIMEDLEEAEEKSKKTEEITVLETPIKENKNEEFPKQEFYSEILLDDIEMMEPLKLVEDEPSPCSIFAVSTPAKNCSPKEAFNLFEVTSKRSPRSEIKLPKEPLTHTPDRKSCPRTFSSISGRRSIRPIGDYTFSGNLQIRESYRKITTELDFTSSSLNVTVGSEVPNNDSFSFFSRSRKRDRSSPTHQSSIEVQGDLSPKSPKRAKIDSGMYGFFNAMASPITMLRARLARASVQSTPKKQIVDPIEKEIVENVSAIAVDAVDEDLTATEEQTFNPDSTVADTIEQPEEPAKCSQSPIVVEDMDDIKIKETITATDSQAKKKCSIM